MKDPTTPSLPLRLGAPLLFALLALPLSAADREFTLEARMTGYVGSGGPIAGERNPTLRVTKGARKSVQKAWTCTRVHPKRHPNAVYVQHRRKA